MVTRIAAGILALIVSTAAAAAGPAPGGGRVDVGPGWRFEPLAGTHHATLAGRFSWQIDPSWALGIDVGLSLGGQQIAAVPARVSVGELAASLAYGLPNLGPVHPYVVGGGGYYVLSIAAADEYREGATQGIFAGVGLWIPIAEKMGFFIEERYTLLARLPTRIADQELPIDLGGNLVWAGLVFVFEPDPPSTRWGREVADGRQERLGTGAFGASR